MLAVYFFFVDLLRYELSDLVPRVSRFQIWRHIGKREDAGDEVAS